MGTQKYELFQVEDAKGPYKSLGGPYTRHECREMVESMGVTAWHWEPQGDGSHSAVDDITGKLIAHAVPV